MMSELFVILPVYKGDKIEFINESMNSILSQTYNDFVLFIVKDGALNKEQEIYFSHIIDSRVEFLAMKENKGLPTALNVGVKKALERGAKYIARMDADDIALPTRFEEQISYMKKNKKIELLGTSAELINEKGIIIGIKNVKQKVSFEDMIKSCELVHPSVMFKSDFFCEYGYYNEHLMKSQDYDLWLRALNKGATIHNLTKPLLKFRYEIAIISRRKKEQDYNIQIKRKYLKGFTFYKSIMKHLAIKYLPTFVLKYLLKQKIK